MTRTFLSSALAVIAFTLLLGVAYPLVIAGAAHVLPRRTVSLARDTKGDPRHFQPRPSADDYDAYATAFSNRGPNQKSAEAFYRQQIAAYEKLNDGAAPPMDAVTTSASGVDPLISQANAAIQARRVARVRHLPLPRVMALVKANTDGRFLGVLGGTGVNTTTLNQALDR